MTNKGKSCNNASYFAIDNGPSGESRRKNGGSRECKVQRAEGLDPPVPKGFFAEQPTKI